MVKKKKSRKRKSVETHNKGKGDIFALKKGRRWYLGIRKKGQNVVFTDAEVKRAKKRAKKIFR